MTEGELLLRAGALTVTDVVDEVSFAALVRSPLLIRRVRSAGGVGGRRVSAGVAVEQPSAFAVLVESTGKAASLSLFADALACAHVFSDEIRRAARDGLSARPEPQVLSVAELLAAGVAALGSVAN